MCPEVGQHVCLLRELLRAYIAREGFFSCMNRSNVSFEIATLCECPMTVWTSVILCSGVNLEMDVPVALLSEALTTSFAIIWSFGDA